PSTLPGFLAEDAGVALGAITYRPAGGECEVVTLNAFEENRGIGTALLLRVKQVADEAGRRLWLITMNDNLRAIGFYQRRGMDMAALHRNFVEVVRAEKPGAGAAGHNGIFFRHAIEFSF
ncbi:MAG TPA: GNAT family N-acetyltransferase, partial [Acidimicrobiales bacterium]|nr:GNAT family N-acetyltransferase [Acidimicrobiales bacterium]